MLRLVLHSLNCCTQPVHVKSPTTAKQKASSFLLMRICVNQKPFCSIPDTKMISIAMYARGNGSSIIGIYFFSASSFVRWLRSFRSLEYTTRIHTKLEIQNGEIHRDKEQESNRMRWSQKEMEVVKKIE